MLNSSLYNVKIQIPIQDCEEQRHDLNNGVVQWLRGVRAGGRINHQCCKIISLRFCPIRNNFVHQKERLLRLRGFTAGLIKPSVPRDDFFLLGANQWCHSCSRLPCYVFCICMLTNIYTRSLGASGPDFKLEALRASWLRPSRSGCVTHATVIG